MEICEQCGWPFTRYGLFRCDDKRHAQPSIAEKCMIEIERDMNNRRGFGFGSFADDIQRKIRNKWIEIIEKAIAVNADDEQNVAPDLNPW